MVRLLRAVVVSSILACFLAVDVSAYTRLQGKADVGAKSFLTSLSGAAAAGARVCLGASVTLYLAGTTTKPLTYATEAGTLKANPTTADANGEWWFYVDEGTYDAKVEGCGTPVGGRTIVEIHVGAGGGSASTGVRRVELYADRGDGAVATVTGTGTLNMTNGSASVNGVGTAFQSQLAIGDIVKVAGTDSLYVRSITSDTLLTLSKVYPGSTASGLAWTFRIPYGGWEDVKPSPCAYESFSFGVGEFVTPNGDFTGCYQTYVTGAGSGATRITGTSTDNVLEFNTGAPTGYRFGVVVEHLWLKSLGQAVNGLYLESTHHSTFYDLKITDVTGAAIRQNFGVANAFRSIRITGNEGDQIVKPAYGMYFDRRDVAESSTTAELSTIHIDQTTNTGIHFEYMGGAILTNVIVEGNTGKGVVLSSNTNKIYSAGLHLESNTGDDLTVSGGYNHEFPSTFCDGNVIWGSDHGKISGTINTLTLTGSFNTYEILRNLTGSGTVTDSGLGNIRLQTGPSSTISTAIDANRFHGNIVFRTDNGADGAGSDPGYTELMERRYKLISATPQNLSETVYATGKPWRVLFVGSFQDVSTGPTLALQPLWREVTSAAPSFTVGGRTVTVSQTVGGVMQIAADAIYVGYAGQVFIVVGNYATGFSSTSIVTPGLINSGGSQWNPVPFAALGTAVNGVSKYCPDCAKTTPCTGAGTGAVATGLNSAWDCDA